jgi:hypothetical protein
MVVWCVCVEITYDLLKICAFYLVSVNFMVKWYAIC